MATTKKAAPARRTKAEVSVANVTLPAIEAPALDFEALRKAALVASGDITTATAYASERFTEYVAADAVAQAAGTRKSVLASLATFAAFKSGALIEGKRKDDTPENVMTFEQWGEFFAATTGGTATSPASVRTWLRAGQALVDFGLNPDSPEAYALLGGLAQRSQWNTARESIVKELEAAREQDPEFAFTPEVIAAKVAEVKAEVDAIVPKKRTTSPSTPEPTAPLDRVKAALAGLSKEDAHAVLAEAAAWLDADQPAEDAA